MDNHNKQKKNDEAKLQKSETAPKMKREEGAGAPAEGGGATGDGDELQHRVQALRDMGEHLRALHAAALPARTLGLLHDLLLTSCLDLVAHVAAGLRPPHREALEVAVGTARKAAAANPASARSHRDEHSLDEQLRRETDEQRRADRACAVTDALAALERTINTRFDALEERYKRTGSLAPPANITEDVTTKQIKFLPISDHNVFPALDASDGPRGGRSILENRAALLRVKLLQQNLTYEDIIEEIKSRIDLHGIGIPSVHCNILEGECMLVMVPPPEAEVRAEALADRLRAIVSAEDVRVECEVLRANIRLCDVSAPVSVAEVAATVAARGGCERAHVRSEDSSYNDSILVSCPAHVAHHLICTGFLWLGQMRVRVKWARPRTVCLACKKQGSCWICDCEFGNDLRNFESVASDTPSEKN